MKTSEKFARFTFLTAVFLTGCADTSLEKASSGTEHSADEAETKAQVAVHGVAARKQPMEVTIDGLGRSEALPDRVGAVTAPLEGHVDKLLCKLGETVAAGRPLVELDTSVIRADLAEKSANCESLKAAMSLLMSPPRPEECRVAELAVEQAKVAVESARAAVERLRPLIARKEVSPQQVFDTEQALKQAELQRASAAAQLTLLKLGPRREAVAEAQSKIAAAEQAVAHARAQLELHTLRAPVAGVVDSLTCHPGQTLTVGTVVGQIVDRQHVFVVVHFPLKTAQNLSPGLSARIDLPAATGDRSTDSNETTNNTVMGTVAFVGSVADPQTGNFPVRILVANPHEQLRLGQLCKATITVRREDSLLTVPEAAIFDQGEGPLLAVIRQGKLRLLHPELGIAKDGWVAVNKTDLQAGEMVVTEGAYNVPEGAQATLLPEEAGEAGAKG